MGKGGLACAAPFPKSCAQIRAQDNGRLIYNRPNQQNFIITKFIVDYWLSSLNGTLEFGGCSARGALQLRCTAAQSRSLVARISLRCIPQSRSRIGVNLVKSPASRGERPVAQGKPHSGAATALVKVSFFTIPRKGNFSPRAQRVLHHGSAVLHSEAKPNLS